MRVEGKKKGGWERLSGNIGDFKKNDKSADRISVTLYRFCLRACLFCSSFSLFYICRFNANGVLVFYLTTIFLTVPSEDFRITIPLVLFVTAMPLTVYVFTAFWALPCVAVMPEVMSTSQSAAADSPIV